MLSNLDITYGSILLASINGHMRYDHKYHKILSVPAHIIPIGNQNNAVSINRKHGMQSNRTVSVEEHGLMVDSTAHYICDSSIIE